MDKKKELKKLSKSTLQEIGELYCPSASGFDGPETFPDCGECVVCKAREVLKEEEVLADSNRRYNVW